MKEVIYYDAELGKYNISYEEPKKEAKKRQKIKKKIRKIKELQNSNS